MAISFQSLMKCLPFVASTKKPIMLRSRHGVGKSTLVYEYGKIVGLPVVEQRASQMTEGDILGLPDLDKKKRLTDWFPPKWLHQACSEPVILFIDELDRATLEVRQGLFELTDSRKIAGNNLHPDTLIFSAVNGGEKYSSQYQVNPLDPAELDRWTVFDLEPTVEDWLLWAKNDNNINIIIQKFILDYPSELEHNEDFEPNKVYPSRRSWHRFSECVTKGKILAPGETSFELLYLTQAFLGLEVASKFTDYVRKYKKDVKPKDIIEDGKIELTKEFDINEHLDMVERFVSEGWFKSSLEKEKVDNLIEYYITLPSEIAVKMLFDFGKVFENGNDENSYRIFISNDKVKAYNRKIYGEDENRKKVEELKNKQKEEENSNV